MGGFHLGLHYADRCEPLKRQMIKISLWAETELSQEILVKMRSHWDMKARDLWNLKIPIAYWSTKSVDQ